MNKIVQFAFFALWCALLVSGVAGCGGSGASTVSGTVSYEGKPVESGEIMFLPTDGEGGVAAGPIENGKYSFESTVGSKRVEINAIREEGVARDGLPNFVSYIPPKYNSQSTLTAEVKSGENSIDFELAK